MQQTKTYNLKLIDTGDPFSPDALNENTQALEDALVTHEAVVDSTLKSQKLELQAADEALTGQLSALTQTVAANKNAAQTALGTETARVNGEISRINAALAERPRMVWGTYVGTGAYGANTPKELDFAGTLGCAPKLLIVQGPGTGEASSANNQNHFTLTAVNGVTSVRATDINYLYDVTLRLTWTKTGVKWTNTNSAEIQLNKKDAAYYYVAFA